MLYSRSKLRRQTANGLPVCLWDVTAEVSYMYKDSENDRTFRELLCKEVEIPNSRSTQSKKEKPWIRQWMARVVGWQKCLVYTFFLYTVELVRHWRYCILSVSFFGFRLPCRPGRSTFQPQQQAPLPVPTPYAGGKESAYCLPQSIHPFIFSSLSLTKSVSLKLLRNAWNAFSRLLDINFTECFCCPLCGPSPTTVICDGTLLVFRKDLMDMFTSNSQSPQPHQPV